MALTVVVAEVIKSLCSTIFARDAKGSLHRTAIFMMVFLIIHVSGNLVFFLGQDAFNAWAHFLNSGTMGLMIVAIEWYLLAAALIHAAAATYQTWRYKKLALPKTGSVFAWPLGQAKLALTGIFLAGYIVLHLMHFKFADNIPLTATGIRDVYQLELNVFQDPSTVLLYLFTLVLLAVHLWSGWAKTVFKFSSESQPHKDDLLAVGQTVIVGIIGGFVASVLGAWYQTLGA